MSVCANRHSAYFPFPPFSRRRRNTPLFSASLHTTHYSFAHAFCSELANKSCRALNSHRKFIVSNFERAGYHYGDICHQTSPPGRRFCPTCLLHAAPLPSPISLLTTTLPINPCPIPTASKASQAQSGFFLCSLFFLSSQVEKRDLVCWLSLAILQAYILPFLLYHKRALLFLPPQVAHLGAPYRTLFPSTGQRPFRADRSGGIHASRPRWRITIEILTMWTTLVSSRPLLTRDKSTPHMTRPPSPIHSGSMARTTTNSTILIHTRETSPQNLVLLESSQTRTQMLPTPTTSRFSRSRKHLRTAPRSFSSVQPWARLETEWETHSGHTDL